MADEEELKVKITLDSSSAVAGYEAILSKTDDVKAAFVAVGDAAKAASDAQTSAAQAAANATVSASAAETEAMIKAGAVALEQIRAKAAAAAQAATAEVAAEANASNEKLAVQIAYYRFLSDMGKQSAEEHRAQLEQLLADEQRTGAERLAVQREIANVDRQIVAESIAQYRAEAEAGVLSADQQKAALRSIAQEAEYSKATRALAATELARIETEEARAAALAVEDAEKQKALAAKTADAERIAAAREAATEERESQKQAGELGMALANIGYLGGPGSGALMNVGYMLGDLVRMAPQTIALVAGIGIAFTAAAGGAALFFDSAKKAGDFDQQLQILGALIRNQGGDWAEAEPKVLAFATALEKATTYSRGDILEGMTQLAKVGVSVGDSETIMRVATDAAAASNKNLLDVVHGLVGAEEGRKRVLTDLGISTAELKDKSLTVADALNMIEKHMAGAAAQAANSLPGALAQLGHAFDSLEQDIGKKFQQPLIDAAHFLTELVDAIDSGVPKMAAGFSSLLAAAEKTFAPTIAAVLSIGPAFENALAAVEPAIARIIAAIQPFLDLVGHTIVDLVNTALTAVALDFKTTFDAIAALADGFEAIFTGNWGKFGDDLKRIAGDIIEGLENIFGTGFAQIIAGVETMFEAVRARASSAAQVLGSISLGPAAIGAALAGAEADDPNYAANYAKNLDATNALVAQVNQYATPSHRSSVSHALRLPGIPNIHLDDNPLLNQGGASNQKAPWDRPADVSGDDSSDPIAAQQKALDETIKSLTAGEKDLADNVSLATGALQKQNAELALAYQKTQDARSEISDISVVLKEQETQLASSQAALKQEQASVQAAAAAYNDYKNSLGSSPTEAEKEKVKQLKQAYDDAEKTLKQTHSTIDELNGDIEKNRAALASARSEVDAYTIAIDKQTASIRENAEAVQNAAIKAITTSYEEDAKFQKKLQEDQQQLTDEEATYGKSLAQQLAYYERRYAQLIAANSKDYTELEKYAEEIQKLEEQEYEERLDALKQYNEKAQQLTQTFVDDIVAKHESLRDSLKDVFKSIEQDFVQMIEQMILKSSLLQGIEKQFGGLLQSIFGGTLNTGKAAAGGVVGGGITGEVGAAASQFGIFGGALGNNGASSVVSQIPTTSILGAIGGPSLEQAAANAAPSGSGVGAGQPWGGDNDWGASGTSGIGGGIGTSGLSVGTAISGAVEGAGLGSAISGILGGNQSNASLGGALLGGAGSVVGTILGGPLGGMIGGTAGSVLGGIVGGLFGSHATPATSPDIYNTQQYGSIIADLMGTSGANGQYFSEDSSTLQDFSGLTGIQGIEELLARGQQAFTQSTGLTAQQYQQYLAMFGASSTGSGSLNFDKNIGEEYITGAQGAGGTYSYLQFGQALTAIEEGLNAHGGADAAIPVFTVSQSYPNANLSTVSQTGTVYGPATTSPNLAGTTPINTTSTTEPTQSPAAGTPTVNVTINGSVVGPGGLETVASQIGAALRRLHTGEAPGAYTRAAGQLLYTGDGG